MSSKCKAVVNVVNMRGAAQEDMVAGLEKVEKRQPVMTGKVSGGQTQQEIERKMQAITDEVP